VAEPQQVAGRVVGRPLVVDGNAGGAGLVADGDGDEDDAGGAVGAPAPEVAGDVGGFGTGASEHHSVAALLGFFLDALHDLGGEGVRDHRREEPLTEVCRVFRPRAR
jgi:hypothetical protein